MAKTPTTVPSSSSKEVLSLPSIVPGNPPTQSNTSEKVHNNQDDSVETDPTHEESNPTTTITRTQKSSSEKGEKTIPITQKSSSETVDTQELQPSLLLEIGGAMSVDVDTEDEDEEVDYDSDEGHDTTQAVLLSPTVTNSSGKNNPNSTPWATADALCYLVDCNNQFLKVSGINRDDLHTVSIINLVKHTTPEKMMQQAYSLDELVSGKVDAGMKWTAELNETYKNINYMIHVTLSDPKSTKSNKPSVMDVTLKPAAEGPQGHSVVNGNLEWGLRRRSSINVLENRMRALSFRHSSVNAVALPNSSEKSNASSIVLAAAEEAQRRCSRINVGVPTAPQVHPSLNTPRIHSISTPSNARSIHTLSAHTQYTLSMHN